MKKPTREDYKNASKIVIFETCKEILESVSNRPSDEELKKEFDKYTKGI